MGENCLLNTVTRKFAPIFLSLILISVQTAPVLAQLQTHESESQGEHTAVITAQQPFKVELTQADHPATALTSMPIAATEPIDEQLLPRLLQRLPAIIEPVVKAFKLPEQTLVRPPLPGTVISQPFPPKHFQTVRVAPNGKEIPLKVLRVSPYGTIDTASDISITFSQPMVPLGEAKSAAVNDFVQLSPQPHGAWQWQGTQTLIFKPANKRLPKATNYRLTVPATCKSISGNHPDQAQSWHLLTPPAEVKQFFPAPGQPQVTSPVMLAIFNQRIERNSIIAHIKVSTGKMSSAVRLADISNLEKNYDWKLAVKDLPTDHWILFQPTKNLNTDCTAKVTFGPACPSAEGALLSTKAQNFFVKIHGPLLLNKIQEKSFSPEAWDFRSFTFSNALDQAKFKTTMVKIEPPAKIQAAANGYALVISGRLKPLTKYTVQFDAGLTDVYGQTLGKKVSHTFVTGSLNTLLNNPHDFVTIARGQKAVYSIWAQAVPRVKMQLYRVKPEDWAPYQRTSTEKSSRKYLTTLLATKVFSVGTESKTLEVALEPYLKHGCGQFIVTWQTEGLPKNEEQNTSSWIQITSMGIDAFKSDDLKILATSLSDGKPLGGVNINLLPGRSKAITNEVGQASINLQKSNQQADVLVASKGDDTAILPPAGGSWVSRLEEPAIRWYTVSDRHLYKPGEEVHIKGWARGIRFSDDDALDLFDCKLQSVKYVVTGIDNVELARGTATVDSSGGFDFNFLLPIKINLGSVKVSIVGMPGPESKKIFKSSLSSSAITAPPLAPGTETDETVFSTSLDLDVQEFRRPDFEMKVVSSLGNSMIAGDKTTLTAAAHYFAGDALGSAPVVWNVNAQYTQYAPAGWEEYNFCGGADASSEIVNKKLDSITDSAGLSSSDLKLDALTQGLPVSCACEASVSDVNRQMWSDSMTLIVHAAKNYVGLKPNKNFYHKNEPILVKVIATDIDGKVTPGKSITIKLRQLPADWQQKTTEKIIAEQTIQSTSQPQTVRLDSIEGGLYDIVATITDENNKRNQTVISTWVEANEAASQSKEIIQTLSLTANQPQYKAGDVAEILVKSPLYPGHGLAVLERNKVISTIPFELTASTHTLKVPISAAYYPNLKVTVYVTGKKSAFAAADIDLKIPPLERQLSLSVSARDLEIAPGSDTTIDIDLKDANGTPVQGGEVAVVAADDAMLALANYKWPDPITSFYPLISNFNEKTYLRSSVLLPEDVARTSNPVAISALPPPSLPAAPGGIRGGGENRGYLQLNPFTLQSALSGIPIKPRYGQSNETGDLFKGKEMSAVDKQAEAPVIVLRKDLSALALFEPAVITDQSGKAQIKLHLPDSLTRYRIMAVAVKGQNRFGSSQSNITARLPLTVKPSPPRFLNFGDHCELPIVVQNQTDHNLHVEVVARAQNANIGQDGKQTAGKAVDVAAHDRVELRFPVSTINAGQALFQCAAASGELCDATEFTLPVYMPATTESTAAYGQIDNGAVLQKLEQPHDVFKQVGGLTIATSSTALQALTDAYFYLKDYAFECSEQISSRTIAMLSLQDVAESFATLRGENKKDYQSQIQKDLDKLSTRQNEDGSFGLWTKTEKIEWPYVSLQVAEAFILAKSKGYKIDQAKLNLSKKYLVNISQHLPKDYDAASKLSLQARALNIRLLENDVDAPAAKQLVLKAIKAEEKRQQKKLRKPGETLSDISVEELKDALPLECAAWLLPVLIKDKNSIELKNLLRHLIDGQIKETAGTAATNGAGYGQYGFYMFYSTRRVDAAVLEALMAENPDDYLIAKLVRGLLGHKKNGAWEGTQENSYVLQALSKYFAKYENVTPNFEASAWLADTLISSAKFAGRSTASHETTLPTAYLLEHPSGDILLNKTGAGRLYYRIGLDYAPTNLNLKAADFGFSVTRTYESVDKKDDVSRDSNGTWHIKSGASVRAKLHFSAPGSRYHVALTDPLPAGAEPLNPDLVGSRNIADKKSQSAWWWQRWFDHQNLRDQQAEAFTALLNAGEYDYSYVMRATTPGDYHVPPTKVQEMYAPETFGRTASEHVTIE